MEYKVGDKVVIIDGIMMYEVKLMNKYVLTGTGIVFDGKRIADNEIITFKMSDIVAKSTKLKEMVMKYDEVIEKEEVEEKKYLKTWEAIKALEEGKEGLIARRLDWLTMEYGPENYMYMNNGKLAINGMIGSNHILNDMDEVNWIVEKLKKEIPKEFEGLKYILGSINNMDCDDVDCEKCPLGMDKCNMLDEIFFDMKEKYNF